MDQSSTEPMNEARLCVYRTAMKVQSLQKLCHMDVVFIQHITAAFQLVGGANPLQDAMMSREKVTRVLNRMFNGVSQEVPGHVTAAASEETSSLMFRLFERDRTGQVSARSLQTALVALSADAVLGKYRSLVRLSGDGSGSVTRSGLRSLLQDLSQVPAAVQEEDGFGSVEAAVSSCFNEGGAPAVSQSHLFSWLKSEPRLLLWLPTLYRLSVSLKVSHAVRCHTCKTFPITGLRYRCKKCVNVHVCQNCFLNGQQTRKHKTHHPVVEFCTQPTWRESLSSLVHNARHALLPWRYTHREADRMRVLTWAEPGETQNRAPPSSDASTLLAESAHSSSSDEEVTQDASVQAAAPLSSSKSLQTDEEPPAQQGAALLTEVRNLQRDKWLLEQQVGAWRLTVQSEQGVLEDRCSEMEVTMEMMRQHNERLQDMLSQALRKMEAQQHANNTPQSFNRDHTDRGIFTPTSDPLTDAEEEEALMDVWSLNEPQTPSPTIPHKSTLSHDEHEEPPEDHQPIGRQGEPEGAGLQTNITCLFDEEDPGMCSPEVLLLETVDRLRMEMDRGTNRNTGVSVKAELVEAAEQLGDSVSHLVDAVRTN
ncbi:dystrotelin [Anableps anableps]